MKGLDRNPYSSHRFCRQTGGQTDMKTVIRKYLILRDLDRNPDSCSHGLSSLMKPAVRVSPNTWERLMNLCMCGDVAPLDSARRELKIWIMPQTSDFTFFYSSIFSSATIKVVLYLRKRSKKRNPWLI